MSCLTLFSARYPVSMMLEFSTCTTRCPSRTRYAPIPMALHVTSDMVTTSLYACEVSLVIVPDTRVGSPCSVRGIQ